MKLISAFVVVIFIYRMRKCDNGSNICFFLLCLFCLSVPCWTLIAGEPILLRLAVPTVIQIRTVQ